METNEDRWFKKIHVDSAESGSKCSHNVKESFEQAEAGMALPPFVIKTHEDINRFQAVSNYTSLRRTLRMTNSLTGQHLDLATTRSHTNNGPYDDPFNGACNGDANPELQPGKFFSQECTSRVGYLGSTRRGLGSASFLTTGQFERDIPVTVFSDMAVVGDLLRFVIPADSFVRVDYVFSVPQSPEIGVGQLCQPLRISDNDLKKERDSRQNRIVGDLSMNLQGDWPSAPDAGTFTHFLTYLQQQVGFCTLLKGYIHPAANSLIGIRDVFQAIEGHLFSNPEEARQKILEALNYVLLDGRCPRQYSLPANGSPGIADLREYVDQGVWVVSAIYTYLSVTGDTSVLEEVVGYHQVDSADKTVALPADRQDSVLEHLLQIVDFLDNQRDPKTGLVLALYGDWNDAIDGLGLPSDPESSAVFGTGVSVMTSLQLYQNCQEMIDLLERFAPGKFAAQLTRIRQLRGELRAGLQKHTVVDQGGERRIVHGWGDQQSYYVGSFEDSDGLARDGLTSNAFWTLTGMLDEDISLREDILAAFERLDSDFGLKTFEPGFGPDAQGIGRIVNVPIGTAENGAAYIHATTFAIAALFRMGESEKAWEQIAKILPFAPHFKSPSHSPFVMPNSYLDNPELNLTGQSMNDWQTGSSNVLLKLLVRFGFGFEPTFDYLQVSPAKHFPYDSFEFQGVAQGRKIKYVYGHGDVAERTISLNGKKWEMLVREEMRDISLAQIPYDLLSSSDLNEIIITDPQDG